MPSESPAAQSDPSVPADVSEPANPFRLLDRFGRTDRLFGRDADLVLTVSRITSARTTLLFAGSGVGKTSFLQSKLIPTLECDYTIAFFSAWSGPDPTARLRTVILDTLGIEKQEGRFRSRSALRRAIGGERAAETAQALDPASLLADEPATKPLLLILDQFEELFQQGINDPRTRKCIGQIAWFVRTYPVRTVISIRDEFLGELSVFDNRLPDVLANHHKLIRPRRAEAESIIRQTVTEKDVDPSALKRLVLDLSRVRDLSRVNPISTDTEKSLSNRATESVAPPFLQIACYRLWEKRRKSKNPRAPFLSDYPDNGAGRELEGFCADQLKPLGFWKRYVASRCFEYLVTRRGAKVAYESRTLARLTRMPVRVVRSALDPLTEHRTRIVRCWDVNGVRWYELYHDIYAPIVQRWSDDNRRHRRHLAPLLVIIFALVAGGLGGAYQGHQSDQASVALLERTADIAPFPVALAAFERLQGSTLKALNAADERDLWAGYLERRAQLAAKDQNRDLALLLWLQASRAAPAPRGVSRRETEAQLLIDDALLGVRTSYAGGTVAQPYPSASDTRVLLKLRDGQLVLWNAADGATEALPSGWGNDGSAGNAAAPLIADNALAFRPREIDLPINAAAPNITALAFNRELGSHVFAGVASRPATSKPLRGSPSRPTQGQGQSSLVDVLSLWDGIGRPLPPTPDFTFSSEPGGYRPDLERHIGFSADGKFVAASQRGGRFGVYAIQSGGAKQLNGGLPSAGVVDWAFGTAGRLFVMTRGRAQQWRLDKDGATHQCSTPVAEDLSALFASATRGEFVTTNATGVSIWTADGNCAPVGKPLPQPPGFRALGLSSDASSMEMVIRAEGTTKVWDLTARQDRGTVVLSPAAVTVPHGLMVVQAAVNGTARALDLNNLPRVRETGAEPVRLAVSNNGQYAVIDSAFSASTAAAAARAIVGDGGPATRILEVRDLRTNARVGEITWDAPIPPSYFRWSVSGTGQFALARDAFGSIVNVFDVPKNTRRAQPFERYVTDSRGEMLLAIQGASGPGARAALAPPVDEPLLVVYDAARDRRTELGKARLPRDLILSNDAAYAAAVSRYNEVSIWRVTDGHSVSSASAGAELLHESPMSTSLYFSRNGRVAIIRGTTVHIGRITGDSQPVLQVDATTTLDKVVSALTFLPDEESVLVASVDGHVQLWRPRNKGTGGGDRFTGSTSKFVLSERGNQVAFRVNEWVHVYDVSQSAFVHNRSRLVDGEIFATSESFFVARPDGKRVSIDTPKVERKENDDLSPETWARRLGQRVNQNGELEPYSPGR